MNKFFVRFLARVGKRIGEVAVKIEQQQDSVSATQTEPEMEIINPGIETVQEEEKPVKKIKETKRRKKSNAVAEFDPRDMMEVMEVPFLALSKNRTEPIIYQSKDGKKKVHISRHTKHYIASIYDWDIILLVAAKMQDILNSGKDAPPRTLIIQRHELLKSLHRHDGKKEEKDLKESLGRLKSTLIETTIRNETGRYDAGFGFLDSWGYTDRKDVKEITITLSQWLYEGICKKGALLKVSQEYFDITSGLKKFLYRTARKHVGNNDSWKFSVEELYNKSGSEQEFKKFKYKLKKAVIDNDIPSYSVEWKEESSKAVILFTNKNKQPNQDKAVKPKAIQKQVDKVVSALKMPSYVTK